MTQELQAKPDHKAPVRPLENMQILQGIFENALASRDEGSTEEGSS
jgi:hypothetical protein